MPTPDDQPARWRAPGWLRAILSGLAGGLAWRLGLRWIFGAAQPLLTDPARQSAKMLSAFGFDPPVPRMYEAPWIVWAALLGVGALWGATYAWIGRRAWPAAAWWGRGLRFGALLWVVMVPWFEFYLPFNVLREPAPLVALELLCWGAVLLLVGLAIAGTDAALDSASPRVVPA